MITVNTNRSRITSEEIAKRKDFNSIYSNYISIAKPFFKTTWFIASTASIITGMAIYLGLTLNATKPSTKQLAKAEIQESQQTITKLPEPEQQVIKEAAPIASPQPKTSTNHLKIETLKSELKTLEAAIPAKPEKMNPENFQIQLDADPKEFPELAIYKDILFEINSNNPNFNPNDANETWNKIAIAKADKNYSLTFSNKKRTVTYKAMPVFEGKALENAIKAYNLKFKNELTLIDAKKAELNKLIAQ